MKLFLGALLTVAIGWGVVLAAPKPVRRQASKAAARRANAEQLCKAQGTNCRFVVRPDAPQDLTGAGCVCDAEPARD
jgi:hypothetical protein